jgi:hypothetical protein
LNQTENLNQTEEWVRTKIKNFADRNGVNEKEIFNSLKKDPMLACTFSHDALKQNVPERVFCNFFKQYYVPQSPDKKKKFRRKRIFALDGFRKMPQSGSHALLFYRDKNGLIRIGTGPAHDDEIVVMNSVDFYGKYICGKKKLRIYFSHKYTKDDGGQQNAQYNELKTFMRETAKIKDSDYAFIAIADGNYYIKPRRNDSTKLDSLRMENKPNIRACTAKTVLGEIALLKYNWLMDKNVFPKEERDKTWRYEMRKAYRTMGLYR